jgi:hypothetical protein
MQPLKKFRFHWLTGEVEEAEGYDIADAFRRAGYGGGALRALDYWEEVAELEEPNHDP